MVDSGSRHRVDFISYIAIAPRTAPPGKTLIPGKGLP